MTAGVDLRSQVVRYGVVGVLNTGLGLALIVALHATGAGILLANVTGYAICWALAFVLNRSWTFEDTRRPTALRIAMWVLVMGSALAANLACIAGLMRLGLPYGPAQIVGCLVYSVLSFLGARHVVFER